MSKSFRPLGDIVLIKKVTITETRGGIALPETEKAHERIARKGEVLSVGNGRVTEVADSSGNSLLRTPMDVSVGDVVWYSGQAGFPLTTELAMECGFSESSEDILCVRNSDIIAVIE